MGTRSWKKAINLEKMFAFTILQWILQISDGLVTLRNEGHEFGQVSKINRVVFSAPACLGNLAAGLESEHLQRHLHWDMSVQFSSVVSDSLWPHGLQHARPPCPSLTPGVYPNSSSLSWWCHPTISSSVISFSSWPQFLPASGSFQMSQLFASGGQSIGVSASALVLPMNIQDWFPLGWTGGSPCSLKDSQVSSPTPQFKSINSSVLSFLYSPTLTSIHDHWKNHSFD